MYKNINNGMAQIFKLKGNLKNSQESGQKPVSEWQGLQPKFNQITLLKKIFPMAVVNSIEKIVNVIFLRLGFIVWKNTIE